MLLVPITFTCKTKSVMRIKAAILTTRLLAWQENNFSMDRYYSEFEII